MRTDLQPLGCGNCGCFKFFVYEMRAEGPHRGIAVECSACKSVTVLRAEATLKLDWGDEYEMKSAGILAPREKR